MRHMIEAHPLYVESWCDTELDMICLLLCNLVSSSLWIGKSLMGSNLME
jgi:hypothetical protein